MTNARGKRIDDSHVDARGPGLPMAMRVLRRGLALLAVLCAILGIATAAQAQTNCTVTANVSGNADTPGSRQLASLKVVNTGSAQTVFASSNASADSPGMACGIALAANERINTGSGFVRMAAGWTVRFSNGATLSRPTGDYVYTPPAGFSGTQTLTGTVTVVTKGSGSSAPPVGATGTFEIYGGGPGVQATATQTYTMVVTVPSVPSITGVSPNAGSTAGGNAVTIQGTGFSTSGNGVTIGGTAAAISTESATSIVVTAPSHAAGAANVVVTTLDGQTATSAGGYTYVAPPAVTAVTPGSGPTAGGNTVTVTGTGFAGATAVTFGGNAATSFVVNSATQITATIPSHVAAGSVTVSVTTAGGTSSLTNGYTYAAPPPAPVVTTPPNGSTVNTATPAVSGSAPANATVTVFVDGGSVGTTTASGGGSFSFTVPSALAQGSHTVSATATNVGGTSASSNTNTFSVDSLAPAAPVIAAPANGAAIASQTPTVSGTAEADSTVSITIDGTARGTTSATGGTFTFTAPMLAFGSHTVSATATDGAGNVSAASGTNTFTIVAQPAVTGVSPAQGTTAGNTAITITGTDFTSGATVTVGGAAATSVAFVSATQLTARTPAGTAGAAAVAVTSAGGTSTTNGTFTYVTPPTATSQSVTTAYNTAVPITLGGTNATIYTVTTAPQHGTLAGTAPNLTYTPTTGYSGPDSFTFTTSNGGSTSAPATVSITVAAALTITPATLPDGAVGTAYSQTLSTGGGTAPYGYGVTAGALPDGLALDAAAGTITGTPTTEGSYGFTVTATDSANPAASASQAYTIAIAAPAGGVTRTWVSGTGDDTNACSRTAPCLTFAAAFARTAAGGEINCVDAGGYGSLTITRSVSIVCGDKVGRAGVLASGQSGITIDAPGAVVVLSGLDFEGIGNSSGPVGIHGVRFVAGASLIVRNAVFRGFRGGYGIDFEPANSAQLTLDRVSVVDSGNTGDTGGVLVRPSGSGVTVRATIVRSVVSNNLQSGIRLETLSGSGNQVFGTIDHATLSGNVAAGLILRNPGGTIQSTLTDSTVSGNAFGVITNGATSLIGNSTITHNGTGLLTIGGGSSVSFGRNVLGANTTDGTFSGTTPRQ